MLSFRYESSIIVREMHTMPELPAVCRLYWCIGQNTVVWRTNSINENNSHEPTRLIYTAVRSTFGTRTIYLYVHTKYMIYAEQGIYYGRQHIYTRRLNSHTKSQEIDQRAQVEITPGCNAGEQVHTVVQYQASTNTTS